MHFFRTIKKGFAALGAITIVAALIIPFVSYAVSASEMKVSELTETTALITGKILTPGNQSIKIRTIEENNPQANAVFTSPFALGPNNTISKNITGLTSNTTYCADVVDASDSSNLPIFGSKICFTTLAAKGQTQTGANSNAFPVIVDSQSATDTGVKINFIVDTSALPLNHGLTLNYSKSQGGTYDIKGGEFFKNTNIQAGKITAVAELKNLDKDTFYYDQVIDTDSKTEYIQSFFKTAPAAGVVLNTGNGTNAASTPGCITGQYCLLAPLPGLSTIDTKNTGVGEYLGIIFKIGIALAGVLAVVMLVVGGIQYMSTDAFSEKASGKERMTQAIIGLILVLGAYVILNTLNPNLTIFNLDLKAETIDVENADTDTPVSSLSQFSPLISSLEIKCPGTGGTAAIPEIAQSFAGKVTYGYGSKGEAGPNGTVKLDCSGYVNRVMQCANVDFVNSGTVGIFANAEVVSTLTATSANDIPLKAGDLIGWKQGGKEKYGHVMIYVGDGMVMDSHGPGGVVAQAVGKFSPLKYKDRIKYVRRAK